MNWKIRTDIYPLPCVKQIASGKPLYSTGCSAQCSVTTERGCNGGGLGEGGRSEREGMYVYLELIHAVVQQKQRQHCKAVTFQLKNN